MEGSTFRFRISFWMYSGIDLWMEIPVDLHQKVCNSVGSNKMDRFEFCFKFADYLKEKFPGLDAFILQEIDKWKSGHFGVDDSKEVLHQYGLTSPWFEDEW